MVLVTFQGGKYNFSNYGSLHVLGNNELKLNDPRFGQDIPWLSLQGYYFCFL